VKHCLAIWTLRLRIKALGLVMRAVGAVAEALSDADDTADYDRNRDRLN
jgi:hypothetical protein